jgi:4-amino-4-deoxy-L-arabinose transferase-like glycosyltransferase
LRRVSPLDEFRTNHVLCAFVAQIGLLGTWRLGRLVAGPLAGLLSLLFLLLTPVYYGHQFNNPKDIPFAAGYVWGLYFIARLIEACAPASSADPSDISSRLGGWRFWPKLTLALALGMAVRVGGAILIGYLLLFVTLVTLDAWRSSRALALALRPIWLRVALAIAAGWALMIASWPRALASPLDGPRTALETVSKYAAYDSPTLLRGKLVPSQHVPWDYLPSYFAIQLPELTTACFLASCLAVAVFTGLALRRRTPIPWAWLLLVVSVTVPPAYAIVRHSTLYNGLRHFRFIIPPISVLAGVALTRLALWSARRHPAGCGLVLGIMGFFILDQVAVSWRLHPHQHVFFNRASGGLVQAVDRYETEYYGSVYQELLGRLAREVWSTRRAEYMNRTFIVAGCGSNLFFKRNLPPNFRYSAMRNVQSADYYATYARDGCLRRLRDRAVVAQVEREGALIAVARDMKRKARPAARAATSPR